MRCLSSTFRHSRRRDAGGRLTVVMVRVHRVETSYRGAPGRRAQPWRAGDSRATHRTRGPPPQAKEKNSIGFRTLSDVACRRKQVLAIRASSLCASRQCPSPDGSRSLLARGPRITATSSRMAGRRRQRAIADRRRVANQSGRAPPSQTICSDRVSGDSSHLLLLSLCHPLRSMWIS